MNADNYKNNRSNDMGEQTDKPALHLVDAKEITFEQIIDLFRQLAGREPTAEEVEEARREWQDEESEKRQGAKPT
jgi:hypothetical protein